MPQGEVGEMLVRTQSRKLLHACNRCSYGWDLLSCRSTLLTQCVTEPPVTPPFQKRRIGGFGSRNCSVAVTMKIAAELRIKHGILYEACQQHGGIKPFAAKIGIGHQTLFKWLHMRQCPTPGVFNQWYTKKVEKRLEKFTGVSAQELFPKQLKEFTELDRPTRFVSVKDIEIQALEWMAEDLSDRLTSSDPASDAITSELREKVQAAVAKLPERQRLIIDARFHRGLTLEETGHELRVTKERVRQGELKAIRLLKESNAFLGFED